MRPNRSTTLFLRLLLFCLAASALHGQVLVTLSTSSNSMTAGQAATLTAVVTAPSGNTGVVWSYSPHVGQLGVGNNLTGTSVTSTNNYVAPASITVRQTVTITATAVQDNTKSFSVQIQLNPTGITVTPATVSVAPGGSAQFSATGGSGNYVWSISPQTGSIDQNGVYLAPTTITNSGTVTVTATSAEDASTFGTAKITLTATAGITVTISPSSATLSQGQAQQFSATVNNASTNSVIWSISPTTTGSIDQTGLYTSPANITVSTKVTVTATAAADSSKSASATVTISPVVDVGAGAPTPTMQNQFITSFFRNGFSQLVTLPPIANVKRLGTTGYVQEFNGVVTGTKLALATISPSAANDTVDSTGGVVQLQADLYAYYTTVGAATAGLPLFDTLACPPIDQTNSCTYDIFDKSYALFAYHVPLFSGQSFTVRNLTGNAAIQFYTEWTARGGITGIGRPVDVETAVTATVIPPATTGTTATMQAFSNGAIYSITSGINKNAFFSVLQPIYGLYVSNNGPNGSLGLPTSQEFALSNGDHRQTFEGGVVQYTPAGIGGPVIRPPVTSVAISGVALGTTLNLTLGQTVTVTATPMSPAGDSLTDRPVSWSTTNSRVITIAATNGTAVLKAVGGGAASVMAASEGVASQKINVIVIAPCCQVGDGAPPSVQQSFKDALTRNKISVQPPVPGPATRVGNGYIQMVQSADAPPVTYLVAESDQIGTAYVLGGAVLAAWQALGGVSGTLGYPVSDLSAGGTQRFENGAALAGSPVRMVSGGILTKWALLGYETGAAGVPVSDPVAYFHLRREHRDGAGLRERRDLCGHRWTADRAGILRHRPDSGALQRAGWGRRRLRHAGGRRVRHGRRAPAEFRRRQLHVVGGRCRGEGARGGQGPRADRVAGLGFRGQPGAPGDCGLPSEQHDQGIDYGTTRFHGGHRQRSLQLGHVLPAEFEEREPDDSGNRLEIQFRQRYADCARLSPITDCRSRRCRAITRPVRRERCCRSRLRVALRDAAGDPVVGAAVTFAGVQRRAAFRCGRDHRCQRTGRDLRCGCRTQRASRW